jgi:hypothetical protein
MMEHQFFDLVLNFRDLNAQIKAEKLKDTPSEHVEEVQLVV